MIGVKIAKPGKDISSQSLSDFVFDSDHDPKTYLFKVSIAWSGVIGTNGATYDYTHNLGFFPNVQAFATSQILGGTRKTKIPFQLVADASVSSPCSAAGKDFYENMYLQIKSDKITLQVTKYCIDSLDFTDKPSSPGSFDYDIDLYFYLPKL